MVSRLLARLKKIPNERTVFPSCDANGLGRRRQLPRSLDSAVTCQGAVTRRPPFAAKTKSPSISGRPAGMHVDASARATSRVRCSATWHATTVARARRASPWQRSRKYPSVMLLRSFTTRSQPKCIIIIGEAR